MQLKAIKDHFMSRISRNTLFWVLMALYMDSSRKFDLHYFSALMLVMFLSYGIPGYIHNLWLIPRFLIRRRYLPYILLLAFLLLLTTIGSYYETAWVNNLVPGLNYMGSSKDVAIPVHIFPSAFMLTLLAFGKFMTDAVYNQRKMEHLEKEKLKSELDSLRSQINPHFLFNALNTIYGMARRTDQQTADAIIKLSDILRHGLYECDDDRINIEKEILFIKQYVEFARLRTQERNTIELHIDAPVQQQTIAPLLLIPFIENAIKHGIGKFSGYSWVNISLSLANNRLVFICENSTATKEQVDTVPYSSGIGLKNVKRRLELLYADKHTLEIRNALDHFSVTLNLELS